MKSEGSIAHNVIFLPGIAFFWCGYADNRTQNQTLLCQASAIRDCKTPLDVPVAAAVASTHMTEAGKQQ